MFRNEARVLLLPTGSFGPGTGWVGLTAQVWEHFRPGHVSGSGVWIRLDDGLRRPDGSSQNEFLWPEDALISLVDAARAFYREGLQRELLDTVNNRTKVTMERDSARDDLDSFKRLVANTALAYAESHNMCEIAEEFLKELGLEMPQVTIEYEVRGRATIQVPRRSARPSLSEVWARVGDGTSVQIQGVTITPLVDQSGEDDLLDL